MGHLVVIAGVSGVGKTTFRAQLARGRFRGYTSTSLSRLVLEEGAWYFFDEMLHSFAISEERLCRRLGEYLFRNSRLLLETHWVNFLLKCGVTVDKLTLYLVRADPEEIYRRLVRRGWPCRKILENVTAELLSALVYEVYSVLGTSVSKHVNIIEVLSHGGYFTARECCTDWLSVLPDQKLTALFKIIESQECPNTMR